MFEKLLTLILLCATSALHAANYLTFTAEADSSAFGIKIQDNYYPSEADSTSIDTLRKNNTPDVHYSLDRGKSWTALPTDTLIRLKRKGDKALLRGYNPKGFYKTDTIAPYIAYTHFVMTGRIAASGSVMSLIDNVGESVVIPNDRCFLFLFKDCISLSKVPELPATTLSKYCYFGMFSGCKNLTHAPKLPATQLDKYCYSCMFSGCKNLKKAPELPATTLARKCYAGMFIGCIRLMEAPKLPATQLSEECYAGMFSGCESLKKAPELPATRLKDICYAFMFNGCIRLLEAPELPATTLAKGCYERMFRKCIRLTQAPELPATTLPEQCYYNMFEDCISLPNAPYPSDTCVASPANNELYGEKKKENGPMDTIDVLRVNQDTTHLKFNTISIVHKYSFGRRFKRINDSKLEIETVDRQKRFFNCEGCTIARYSVDQKEGIAYLTSIDIVSDSKDDEAHLRTTTQDGELVSDITLNLSPSMTIYLSINDSLIKIDSIGPLPDIKKDDKLKLVAIADDGRKLKILQSSWWDDDRMGGTLTDVCTDDQIVNKTFMCLQEKRWKKTWVSIWVMAQESNKIWRPRLRFFWSPKE